MHASKYGRGYGALRPVVNSPLYDCSDYTDVPLVDAIATMADDGPVTIFAVNRDLKGGHRAGGRSSCVRRVEGAEHIVLHHDDVKAVNTEENPDNVALTPGAGQLTAVI